MLHMTTLTTEGADVVYTQPTNLQLIVQLTEKADDTLFNKITYNPPHLLHPILPKLTDYILL